MYHPLAFNHTTPWYEHTRLCTARWVLGLAQTFVQTLCVLFQGLSLKHNLQVCWEPCYVALCIVLGDNYAEQPWLKRKAFWLPSWDTSHRKLVTKKQEHLVMATGIQADWSKGSPQLCVHYLAVTAASVLYHSSGSRMETYGASDLPVTGKHSFLFGFACSAYMCLARPRSRVSWEYFSGCRRLERAWGAVLFLTLQPSIHIGVEPGFATPKLAYNFVCSFDNVLSSPVAGWYSFCTSAVVKWCWTVILSAAWGCTSL